MSEVVLHRLKYMLSPQLDLYRHAVELAKQVMPTESVRPLDIGCGTGVGTLQMIQPGWARPTAYETDEDLAMFCANLWGHLIDVDVMDLEEHSLLFPPQPYDFVTCIEVAEHVHHLDRFMRGVRASVAPGGLLVISVPNADSQVRKNDDHRSDWTYDRFRKELDGADMELAIITDYRLADPLPEDTNVTPLCGVWRRVR